jgi:hypothetical protein
MNATKREDLLKVTTIKFDDFQQVHPMSHEEYGRLYNGSLLYEVIGWQGIKVLVKIDAGNPLRVAEIDRFISASRNIDLWAEEYRDGGRLEVMKKFWGDTPQLFLR